MLSVVPVRKEPDDLAEMVTQLLFGDHFEILETHKSGKWVRIQIYFDNYSGWIDSKQYTGISQDFFASMNRTDLKITLDLISTAICSGNSINVVAGSVLPVTDHEIFNGDTIIFKGETKPVGEIKGYEFMKKIAIRYLNAPYLWGGKSPFGIDCSGFTQVVFKICGYALLRDASQQFTQGESVENIGMARPGDLAFFRSSNDRIGHVGIILDNLDIIHASGQVRIDKLDEKGIFRKDFNRYTHNFAGLRRILK